MEAIYVGYVAAGVYVILPFIYGITAPDWRKTQAGASFMVMLIALALVFTLITTTRVFGEYQGREAVRAVIYGLVLVAGARVGVLFLQLRYGKGRVEWLIQQDARDRVKADQTDPGQA